MSLHFECHFVVTFWLSEIRDHSAREKTGIFWSFDFTDGPVHVKYAYLKVSSAVDLRGWSSEVFADHHFIVALLIYRSLDVHFVVSFWLFLFRFLATLPVTK